MLVGSLGSRLVDVGLRWDALLLCACVRASCVWICVSGCFGSLLEVEEKKAVQACVLLLQVWVGR